MNKGKVYIAGAGCGSKDLLTLEVFSLISKCDVILYDSLMDEEILKINDKAVKIFTGKRKGHHFSTQDQIHELIRKYAGNGFNVLRLKGGDPFVFGRGMEEYEYCRQQGIDCQVFPGISSCIAVPERVGIPVTYRNAASSFMVVTAHTKNPDVLLSEDPALLAQFQGTVVVLMGLSKAEAIASALIQAGKKKETPIAVISSSAVSESSLTQATLETISEALKRNPASSPAVLVIGEVAKYSFHPNQVQIASACTVELNQKIQNELPLNYHLVSCMQACVSFYEFSEQQAELLSSLENTWLLFTSAKGAKTFLDQYLKSKDIRTLFPAKIACIGPGTASVFQTAYIEPDWTGMDDTTSSMAAKLAALIPKNQRIISIREKNAGPGLEDILSHSHSVERLNLYEIRYVPKKYTDEKAMIFGSSRQVRQWFETFEKWNPECTPICISADCAREFSCFSSHPVITAPHISAKGLASAVLELK